MHNPDTNTFVPLSDQMRATLDGPIENLTPEQKTQRQWTRFSEGETVNLKGVNFRVDEIGERRIILKPINKAEFAEAQVPKT